jgi:hypothetical protein
LRAGEGAAQGIAGRSLELPAVIQVGNGAGGDHGRWVVSAIDRRQVADTKDGMDVILDHLLLKPHPGMPPDAVSSVSCGVSWRNAGEWVFSFNVAEPPEALRLPKPVAAARADDLWATTCFELFVRRPGERSYIEFNFSPSGRWAAYAFDDYREGRRDLDIAAPRIMTSDPGQFAQASLAQLEALGIDPETARSMAEAISPGDGPISQFALNATLEDSRLAAPGPWVASVTAVIEEARGAKSYWALAHVSDKPDFHHPDSFVLDLP